MSFLLSKLFWAVASPDSLIVLLVMTGLAAWLMGWRWIGRILHGLCFALILALTFLPVGDWLLRPLELRFPQPPPPARVDGVIILGGGIDDHMSRAWGQPKITGSGARLVMGVDLAKRYPTAKVLYSGGSGYLRNPDETEAVTAGAVLVTMGLDPDRLILERSSRNTYENAIFSKELAKPKEGEVWLLVTSAYHMPRAVGIFRQAGWPVVPFPVDYDVTPTMEFSPSFFSGLTSAYWGSKEWIGLFYYYLAGRTDALFPGP